MTLCHSIRRSSPTYYSNKSFGTLIFTLVFQTYFLGLKIIISVMMIFVVKTFQVDQINNSKNTLASDRNRWFRLRLTTKFSSKISPDWWSSAKWSIRISSWKTKELCKQYGFETEQFLEDCNFSHRIFVGYDRDSWYWYFIFFPRPMDKCSLQRT